MLCATNMHLSEFDYELPNELIAIEPAKNRDGSRMLIMDRHTGQYRDSVFAEFPSYFQEGDVIVINNTRVFPARLTGRRILPNGKSGAAVEFLLVRPLNIERTEWETLAKPGRSLPVGAEVQFNNLHAVILKVLDDGKRIVRFHSDDSTNKSIDSIIDKIGRMPLPPYIKHDDTYDSMDRERYQTVYAKERGAIAAPTAGLHFTQQIFDELKARSISIVEITHHVGYATFQPIRVEEISEHHIPSEEYEIGEAAANTINTAKQDGKRIIAVGTTTTRALESASRQNGTVQPQRASTELFIYPGYKFRVPDVLLTNFHLPKSSLLMLVAAFADHQNIMNAYKHAVNQKYRFFSYGDCMLII